MTGIVSLKAAVESETQNAQLHALVPTLSRIHLPSNCLVVVLQALVEQARCNRGAKGNARGKPVSREESTALAATYRPSTSIRMPEPELVGDGNGWIGTVSPGT